MVPHDWKELFIQIGSQIMKNLCALSKIIWIAAAVLEKKFSSIKGNPVSQRVAEQGWGMNKVVSICASGEEVVWRDIGDPSGVLGLWVGVLLFDEGINTPVPWVCQDSQSVSYFKLNSIMKSTDLCGIEVSQGHILLSKLAQFDSNAQACALVKCVWLKSPAAWTPAWRYLTGSHFFLLTNT